MIVASERLGAVHSNIPLDPRWALDEDLKLGEHHAMLEAADEAVTWYERAAEDALRIHADADAVRVLRRALELVRDPQHELRLTTTLVAPLAMLRGRTQPTLLATPA